MAQASRAHETEPAVADVSVGAERVVLDIRMALEPVIAGIDLDAVTDTDDSPLSGLNDRLRALPPDALGAALREAWPAIAARIDLRAGDAPLAPRLDAAAIPPVGDVETRRDSTVTISADLPPGDAPVTLGWDGALGGLVVRQVDAGATYAAFLASGAASEPMPRLGAPAAAGPGAALAAGFRHVLWAMPAHALFAVAMALGAAGWRGLLWRLVALAAGQTAMLVLTGTGALAPPPLIALAPAMAATVIAMAAWSGAVGPVRGLGLGRAGLLFAVGLLHGLSLAAGLAAVAGSPPGALPLVAFNAGAELALIAVTGLAILGLILPFSRRPWYRRAVVVPGAALAATLAVATAIPALLAA